jgi:hypothetical protein
MATAAIPPSASQHPSTRTPVYQAIICVFQILPFAISRRCLGVLFASRQSPTRLRMAGVGRHIRGPVHFKMARQTQDSSI